MSNQLKLLGNDFESKCFINENVKCLFCEHEFDLSFKLYQNKQKVDRLRKHLIEEHQFIISEINEIDDLNGYLNYWKSRICNSYSNSLKSICAVIKTNSRPEDNEESIDYFMLCPDILPEDQLIRQELKLAKLNYLMNVQEIERNETDFERSCLFCRKIIVGNRSELFDHLNKVHNLWLGNPNNIVFVKEFLNLIEKKLNQKICLYCERSFKNDWQVLKEHMRKKNHRILAPHNKEYDEFYLVNYLKTNKKWYKNKGNESEDEKEENWENYDDWIDSKNELMNCLFCDNKFDNLDNLKLHLLDQHLFDFNELDKLSFYKKVQLINFIRSKTKRLECLNCDIKFESIDQLNKHQLIEKHNQIPDINKFNSLNYFTPVIENDLLLRLIDVDDNLTDDLDSKLVIAEDEL